MPRVVVALVLAGSSLAHAQDALPPVETTTPPAPAETTTTSAPADATSAAPPAEATNAAPPAEATSALAPPGMSDQAIGAALGAAIGGRTTAGGLRVAGHFLYQLSTQDWFDGTAAFTFGSGAADCFRDRDNDVLCDHGLADGYGVELSANVRRFLGGNGKFWPFARAGMGVALVRFSDDDVTGVAIPLHVGAGLRVSISEAIALTGLAELAFGIARFTNGVGVEPQLGVNVSAGAEFRL